jgi:hypothetical protein
MKLTFVHVPGVSVPGGDRARAFEFHLRASHQFPRSALVTPRQYYVNIKHRLTGSARTCLASYTSLGARKQSATPVKAPAKRNKIRRVVSTCSSSLAQSSLTANRDRFATPGSPFRPLKIEVSPAPTSAGAPNPDLTAFSMSTGAWDDSHSSNVDNVMTRTACCIPEAGKEVSGVLRLVRLHHPGYPDDVSDLLVLPTCSINTKAQPCAEYWLAWQACYVLVIERVGFFTAKRERSSDRITPGQGLVEGHYWYHLDGDTDEEEQYATLQSFRVWEYNEESMPSGWSEAVSRNGRDSADQEPGDCCLSGIDYTQEARVVPEAEYDWAIRNHMQFQVGMGGATTQNSAYGSEMDVRGNMIHLSHTVQRLWDDDYFCLFPLKLPGGGGGCRLHCLFTEPLRKAIRMYHRRPLRGGLSQLSPACAWARFVLLVCRKYESTFLAEQTRGKLGGSKIEAQWTEADQILQ